MVLYFSCSCDSSLQERLRLGIRNHLLGKISCISHSLLFYGKAKDLTHLQNKKPLTWLKEKRYNDGKNCGYKISRGIIERYDLWFLSACHIIYIVCNTYVYSILDFIPQDAASSCKRWITVSPRKSDCICWLKGFSKITPFAKKRETEWNKRSLS